MKNDLNNLEKTINLFNNTIDDLVDKAIYLLGKMDNEHRQPTEEEAEVI